MQNVGWLVDDFVLSLTDVSVNTVVAYRTDVEAFAEWAARSDLPAQTGDDRRSER